MNSCVLMIVIVLHFLLRLIKTNKKCSYNKFINKNLDNILEEKIIQDAS